MPKNQRIPDALIKVALVLHNYLASPSDLVALREQKSVEKLDKNATDRMDLVINKGS